MTSNTTAFAVTARSDRVFYTAMALLLAIVIVAGFAPTFYLRAALFDLGPLRPALVAHGSAGTAWVVLFAVQPLLIALRRVALHRGIGVAGAVIAAAMYVTGLIAIAGVEALHDGESAAVRAVHLFANVAPLTEFAGFVALAIWYRRAAALHKRWMLLATVALLPAATARLFGYFDLGDWNVPTYIVFAFANAGYDLIARGRVHPVSLWGAVTLLAVELVTDGLLLVV